MKFFPRKETIERWEFVLTIAITLIVAAELYYAWRGAKEANMQFKVLQSLEEDSKNQLQASKDFNIQEAKAAESLQQMNDNLKDSLKDTENMAKAMRSQLAILRNTQSRR
jgi:hypothetical protein